MVPLQKLGSLQFHRQVQQLLQNVAEGLGPSSINSSKSLVVTSPSGLGSSILLSKLVRFVWRILSQTPVLGGRRVPLRSTLRASLRGIPSCPGRTQLQKESYTANLADWSTTEKPGSQTNYRKSVA